MRRRVKEIASNSAPLRLCGYTLLTTPINEGFINKNIPIFELINTGLGFRKS
jgi:hypothetical protein